MTGKFQDIFGSDDQDDGTYRAWRTCQQGTTMYLKLVPAASTGDPIRHIPYLQPITIEYRPETGQLCLLCHSTEMKVFLEGRGLEELGDQIAEKRIKSVYMLDLAVHLPLNNENAVITKITVE